MIETRMYIDILVFNIEEAFKIVDVSFYIYIYMSICNMLFNEHWVTESVLSGN